MGRNITVTFGDGSTHVYANAPDNITPEAVTARAAKDFGKPVKSLDGGRSAAVPTPQNQQIAPPVRTRQQEIQEIARATIARNHAGRGTGVLGSLAGAAEAVGSGVNDWLPFDVVNRATAGIERLTGQGAGRDYQDQLQIQREISRQLGQQNRTGRIVGDVAGAIGGGTGLARGVGYVAGAAARSAAPVISTAGNYLSRLTTLERGRKAANAGKLAVGGATYGATDAALDQKSARDIAISAGVGAVAAPAAVTAGYVAKHLVGLPVANLLRVTRGKDILRQYVKTPIEDLQRLAADWRNRTGAEPTLAEILPQRDREGLRKLLGNAQGGATERATRLVRERVASIGPEIAARAAGATAPQLRGASRGIARDLAVSRGGAVPTADEAALGASATRSPLDLARVQTAEARNIMAPHDNAQAYDNLNDMLPQMPVRQPNGSIAMRDADPQISDKLRRVAGNLRLDGPRGITISQVTRMRETLMDQVAKGAPDADVAQAAANHLDDILQRDHPDAADAAARMREAFASRARMEEGVAEGGRARLESDVGTVEGAARQRALNAYGSPEGAVGRMLGQTTKIEQDALQSPDAAIRAVQDMAENPTAQDVLAQNLGRQPASEIIDAAQGQAQSVRNLSKLRNDITTNPPTDLSATFQGLLALTPGALGGTKARAAAAIAKAFKGIPEARANAIVDGLLSRSPARIAPVLKMLNNAGDSGRQAIREMTLGLQAANVGGSATDPQSVVDLGPDAPIPGVADVSVQLDGGPEARTPEYAERDAAAARPVAEADSPYAANLQSIYDNESPEMLGLIRRVMGQESAGGNQFDKDGKPLTSSAGAIGAMQVMPDTAPEAAQLAGVPFDEKAYRNDPAYNKLIGIAYLSELLRKYDGDVVKATAAYNVGKGKVDKHVANGGDWLSQLPPETQDYVKKVAA